MRNVSVVVAAEAESQADDDFVVINPQGNVGVYHKSSSTTSPHQSTTSRVQ